jgi:excisionase family DNA binding protein
MNEHKDTTGAHSEPVTKILLDKREAAALLGCSWRHVQNLTARRLLPSVRLGRLIKYRRSDIERALDKLTVRSI